MSNKFHFRDDATGVTVEEWPEGVPRPDMLHVHVHGRMLCMIEGDVREAILRGLLCWKLELSGYHATSTWVAEVLNAHYDEHSR